MAKHGSKTIIRRIGTIKGVGGGGEGKAKDPKEWPIPHKDPTDRID